MLLAESTIKTRFCDIRATTVAICKPLQPEDYVVQPIVDVSPPKWHLGHTTWFFETFILQAFQKDYQVFDPNFNYLFNSYYESVGARVIRTNRGNITRPGVEEVLRYRAHVDAAMSQLLEGDLPDACLTLIELGLQHEQQHQELLLYDIKYILGNNPLFPAYGKAIQLQTVQSKPLSWLSIDQGNYTIGFNGDGFCFDNELGHHTVFLHDYAIANRLVTNGEFLEFIEAKGYDQFEYWLSEGWEWVRQNKVQAPEYWHFIDNQWYVYNLNGGLQLVDKEAPVVHISFFEADAYAKWKGLRLPTEFEWEIACNQFGTITKGSNFSESGFYQPTTANENQLYGNLWEWTASAYRPYPYYKAPPGAVGEYNGKFMVNQMVLRGGSCATPQEHIRPTYRNFFHPHLRWMFSGIRLAKHL